METTCGAEWQHPFGMIPFFESWVSSDSLFFLYLAVCFGWFCVQRPIAVMETACSQLVVLHVYFNWRKGWCMAPVPSVSSWDSFRAGLDISMLCLAPLPSVQAAIQLCLLGQWAYCKWTSLNSKVQEMQNTLSWVHWKTILGSWDITWWEVEFQLPQVIKLFSANMMILHQASPFTIGRLYPDIFSSRICCKLHERGWYP